MNKIILLGNLTRDPELRYSQGENALAIVRFSLAVNRKYSKNNQEPQADFFNCTAFGKQAEFVEKYFRQGSRMLLAGHVQNDNYTNNKGEKVYSVQIIAEEIEFAEKKGNTASSAKIPDPSTADDFMSIPDGVDEGFPFN